MTNVTFLVLAAAGLAIAASAPVQAQSIAGDARVADGGSLVVAGRKVRLFGIDAPELDQTCDKDGYTWRCGEAAKAQLEQLVAGQHVECRGQGVDQYARTLAVCSSRYGEINRIMVEQGWALAYRRFSDAYVAEEMRAKATRQGLWTSTFTIPSEFRHSKVAAHVQTTMPHAAIPGRAFGSARGCAIKGNRNRRGQWIYHLPGMPYYEQTRAEEVFCTEAEAQAAGYRRAIVHR
jgi:endonuclease YncB( thermonuclease family)